MSDVVDISNLEPEERQKRLAEKPLDYFKLLKNCPDVVAAPIYEEVKRRWERAEERVKELEALVKDVKWEDGSIEEDRYEIVSEVMDKAMQGFEINEEHIERKVKLGHRIVLETKMLIAMGRAFDRVKSILKDFYAFHDDKNAAMYERDDLRQEIRLLDASFTEAHTGFLKSYLDMDW
ncbi:unnamed protein product [Bursaphelenchus okinawaensis]|uniref:Uncharacterized protein n=1 Tax=Bursaphelenchus okinawaensis TaxID=465554 RepID=A0A811L958_9BILA|nr:unnamed protein product [Bursaphelenchus okinawaensis]CAG9118884.1 unnamed protein product [Bursaphelenchus okinawaensis]